MEPFLSKKERVELGEYLAEYGLSWELEPGAGFAGIAGVAAAAAGEIWRCWVWGRPGLLARRRRVQEGGSEENQEARSKK